MNDFKILKKELKECSICGEVHEVELCEETTEVTVKNEKVLVKEKYYRCNKYDTENTYVSGNMWNESLLNGLDAYRKKFDLLTSKDIKSIREKYGLTQSELAFLLNLGEITITRYETKQIQEKSNDNILREINNNAILALNLLQKNKNKFNIKRYKEIEENIKNVIDKETRIYLNEQEIISMYIKYTNTDLNNGNCILDIEKLKNILAYITKQMKCVKKTVLMKILWYIDAYSFKLRSKAITGLVYEHMPYGALPIAADEILKLSSINYTVEVIEEEQYKYNIYNNENFKIVGLSKKEKEIIDKVINKFKNFGSREISEYMHSEKAYIETGDGEIISFAYTKDLKEF